eukprot:TRINITY_DN58_c3_g1_i1.p1 TRINITY_DN58_c3_g1~~TRINITY_DN58_c3_g1_i1.p1  ORF type:complete len:907 (+),score=466.46 TRINITY_DN58_c3_g1_i1:49-2769(+)
MPKFFAESDYESEEEENESEEEVVVVQSKSKPIVDDDDDYDENKPKVRPKSNQEKKLEKFFNSINDLNNELKEEDENDWIKTQTSFENLMNAIKAASNLIQKNEKQTLISCFFQLKKIVTTTFQNKEIVKKLAANQAKALTALNAKIQKALQPYNSDIEEFSKTYVAPVKQIKKTAITNKQTKKSKAAIDDDDDEEEDDEDNEDDDDDEDEEDLPIAKSAKKTAGKTKTVTPAKKPLTGRAKYLKTNDDDDDSDDSDDDFFNSDDSDDFPAKPKDTKKPDRSKWLKKDTKDDIEDSDDDFEPVKSKKKAAKKKVEVETEVIPKKTEPKATPKNTEPKAAPKKTEAKAASKAKAKTTATATVTKLTAEAAELKINEILAQRAKKVQDRDLLNQFINLIDKVPAEQQAQILVLIISPQLEANQNSLTPIPPAIWTNCKSHLVKLANVLPSLKEPIERINESTILFYERLFEESIKTFQNTIPQTKDYNERIKEFKSLESLGDLIQSYFQNNQLYKSATKIAILRIEILHSQAVIATETTEKAITNAKKTNKQVTTTISQLVELVIEHGDSNSRAHAILYKIYFLATIDNFSEAKNLLLMTHLQEFIQFTEIPTQILFNRTIAQLGLCAFRVGFYQEAHNCLAEICGNRIRELVAQGFGRYTDKTVEQEKLEKKRQTPPHLHINLELLECVNLTCGMLLEVPNIALNPHDSRRKILSKTFKRHLDNSERQPILGPPENIRDYIVAAAKALMHGDWRRCNQLLLALPVWNNLNNFTKVKEILHKKIQEEGLRTYLLTFSNNYDSFLLDDLMSIFELNEEQVHSLVCKMIINDEIQATWHHPTRSLCFHRAEPTRLQALALQLCEKLNNFTDYNERINDPRGLIFNNPNKNDNRYNRYSTQNNRNYQRFRK